MDPFVRGRTRVEGRSCVGVSNGRIATPYCYGAEDGAHLQALADQAAVALRNARLFAETSHRAEQMATLNRIGLAITSGLELNRIMEALQIICWASAKMNNIIEELFLLAQVRRPEVAVIPLPIEPLVNEALGRLRLQCEELGAEVIWPGGAGWPEAWGHGAWVEEVWVNCISNASSMAGDHRGSKSARRLRPMV